MLFYFLAVLSSQTLAVTSRFAWTPTSLTPLASALFGPDVQQHWSKRIFTTNVLECQSQTRGLATVGLLPLMSLSCQAPGSVRTAILRPANEKVFTPTSQT